MIDIKYKNITQDKETVIRIEDGEVTITSDSVKIGGTDAINRLIDERLITFYNSHAHTYSEGTTSAPTVPLVAETCATEKTVAE